MLPLLRPFCLLVAALAPIAALQIQDAVLRSPFSPKTFEAVLVPVDPNSDPGPADMGSDTDGCRHNSGRSEYDYFVVVDPHTYFAALGSEWDQRSGRFLGEIPSGVQAAVEKEFASERAIDYDRIYKNAVQQARAYGRQPPERAGFVVPQDAIPIEKRYRLALSCYAMRGTRHVWMAKIALNGAWALRCRAQVPIANPALEGGVQEVNDRVQRHIEDGETFELQKWLGIYKKLLDGNLTREGTTVAGLAQIGFLLRDGDVEGLRQLLAKLGDQLDTKDDKPDILKGLIRERRRLAEEHNKLLTEAVNGFVAGLAAEEVVRSRIPEILLVVGEGLRRTGNGARAMDWYLALGKLPETQPALRAELRAQSRQRALPADKPYHVQLGWIADEAIERLTKEGVVHPGEIAGADKGLLLAILNEGLGTADYNAPAWYPAKDGNQMDCAVMLDIIGKAVLDFSFRQGVWPKSLGELWERQYIDRNRVNRFHCPVSGKPFLYSTPPGEVSRIAPSTVLIASPMPLPTNQGPRYGAFLANTQVRWVERAPVVGQPIE